MKDLIRLAWNALFLHPAPYAQMIDRQRPFVGGLVLVVGIAVAVALAGLVGTTLEWATTPKMSAIKDVVLEGLEDMPWFEEFERQEPDFPDAFRQQYDWGWRIFPRLFGAPDIPTAALRILWLPLILLSGWLLYGVVAHLFARMLGGEAGLGQTLSATALAMSPHLLQLLTLLPYLVVGGVVGTWVILCRYVAIKASHRLTPGRALAATLLPYALLALFVASFACLGGFLMAFLSSVIFGGNSR
jgi:hypothetical protein